MSKNCPDCGKPWSEHDMGVPSPYCPVPVKPAPIAATVETPRTDKIVQQLKDKFTRRSERGLQKYGKSLERTDLTFAMWLGHLQEELMDAALYIETILTNEKQQAADLAATRQRCERYEKALEKIASLSFHHTNTCELIAKQALVKQEKPS